MAWTRLSDSVQTVYAELLDQLRVADAERLRGLGRGSLVSKEIKGRRYWYIQRSQGATKQQTYLGPDGSPVVEAFRRARDARVWTAEDDKRAGELVKMLAAGGMTHETAGVGSVLRVLSDMGVFTKGGVVVGTLAFRCLANALGVKFSAETLRTADVDVAHDPSIPVAVGEYEERDVLRELQAAEPLFLEVPGLDPREPSTSFKVRGRELRVDFLVPDKSHGRARRPVPIPHLRVSGTPLKGLDYLIAEPIDAIAIAGKGVRIQIPQPARFAFHKLWLARHRPASEHAKARKDQRQGEQLLEVLRADRPDDVAAAYEALPKAMRRAVA